MPKAISDLGEIQAYIRDRLKNPDASKRIAKSILASCERLAQFPKSGMSLQEKTGYESDQHILFSGNYLAAYHIEGKTVLIDRILDARQDYCALLFGEVEE